MLHILPKIALFLYLCHLFLWVYFSSHVFPPWSNPLLWRTLVLVFICLLEVVKPKSVQMSFIIALWCVQVWCGQLGKGMNKTDSIWDGNWSFQKSRNRMSHNRCNQHHHHETNQCVSHCSVALKSGAFPLFPPGFKICTCEWSNQKLTVFKSRWECTQEYVRLHVRLGGSQAICVWLG